MGTAYLFCSDETPKHLVPWVVLLEGTENLKIFGLQDISEHWRHLKGDGNALISLFICFLAVESQTNGSYKTIGWKLQKHKANAVFPSFIF